MSAFTDSEGRTLPTPTARIVHRHSSQNARSSPIECTVLEIEHAIVPATGIRMGEPRFRQLTASANEPRWNSVASEFLAALVAQRISEGWTIVSLTDTGASLHQD